jgi:hypothetical protein
MCGDQRLKLFPGINESRQMKLCMLQRLHDQHVSALAHHEAAQPLVPAPRRPLETTIAFQ